MNQLFTAVARRYDLINDLQSFGLHRYWKRRVIDLARPRPGEHALDVCCGTGDLALALARHGVQTVGLDFNEPMLRWEPDGEGVRIVTANRTCRASRLLLAAGAWVGGLIPELRLPLTIERQVLFWFEPHSKRQQFQPQNCPIYLWEYASGRFFYGFPDLGDGVKVAFHHQGETAEPDLLRREVDQGEIEDMRELLRRFLPAAEGRLTSAVVCLYTNTPDEHFIIDRHPAHPQVVIASPCSGHGFKFSSVIGEIASNLLCDDTSAFDLSLFKLERF